METKICNKCKQEKSVNEFYKNCSFKDNFLSQCIECRKKLIKNPFFKRVPNKYIHLEKGITKIIITSPRYGIKECLIDTKNFEMISQYWWSVLKKLYVTSNKNIYIHRLIMNCSKELEVDHKNHNPLDNRKCNLRICSHADNQHNYISNIGSSIYTGVSYNKKRNKWESYFNKDYKKISLGCFDSEIKAAKVRDKAIKNNFGKFANLNFQGI